MGALGVHVAAQQIQGGFIGPVNVEHAAAGREVAAENADRGIGLLLHGKPAGQLRRQPVVIPFPYRFSLFKADKING
jgi:hypothetical protein